MDLTIGAEEKISGNTGTGEPPPLASDPQTDSYSVPTEIAELIKPLPEFAKGIIWDSTENISNMKDLLDITLQFQIAWNNNLTFTFTDEKERTVKIDFGKFTRRYDDGEIKVLPPNCLEGKDQHLYQISILAYSATRNPNPEIRERILQYITKQSSILDFTSRYIEKFSVKISPPVIRDNSALGVITHMPEHETIQEYITLLRTPLKYVTLIEAIKDTDILNYPEKIKWFSDLQAHAIANEIHDLGPLIKRAMLTLLSNEDTQPLGKSIAEYHARKKQVDLNKAEA